SSEASLIAKALFLAAESVPLRGRSQPRPGREGATSDYFWGGGRAELMTRPRAAPRGSRRRRSSGVAEEIALADRHAVLAKNVVGGRRVQVDVRHRVAEQQLHALVARLLARHGQHDLVVLGAVDAIGRHAT